ncbi:hypothetical protein HF998_03210 [Cellulomonas hominis]|uniref:Uncharacterized protein n=1 Tax=Cellulomonas hominis TaxID=156981 RepID=A0A7W8SGS0_9CELL|nr:hypothetical protein [Cellulomonas hominis]MBB5474733.1 hypothetical protein [Cellulomonas hominis]NKY05995.1 hypothetical protein [Cellulomonas hominis]
MNESQASELIDSLPISEDAKLAAYDTATKTINSGHSRHEGFAQASVISIDIASQRARVRAAPAAGGPA